MKRAILLAVGLVLAGCGKSPTEGQRFDVVYEVTGFGSSQPVANIEYRDVTGGIIGRPGRALPWDYALNVGKGFDLYLWAERVDPSDTLTGRIIVDGTTVRETTDTVFTLTYSP